MIAKPKVPKRKVTAEHQQLFLTMLPTITRVARQSFSDLDAEGKEEAVAEVVAAAYVMYVGLVAAEEPRRAEAAGAIQPGFGGRRIGW